MFAVNLPKGQWIKPWLHTAQVLGLLVKVKIIRILIIVKSEAPQAEQELDIYIYTCLSGTYSFCFPIEHKQFMAILSIFFSMFAVNLLTGQ